VTMLIIETITGSHELCKEGSTTHK